MSTSQYQRLLNIVHAKGHSNISDYLRFLALEKDLLFENKFNEIHSTILKLNQKLEKLSEKKNKHESYLI
ncbi:hypothetical protein HY837_00875, partial [archaeon]|nr:hypothetical protein [archaeon]